MRLAAALLPLLNAAGKVRFDFLPSDSVTRRHRIFLGISRKPVPKAHGKPNPTGEEEAFIAYESRLQADHARFLGIDDLQAQA